MKKFISKIKEYPDNIQQTDYYNHSTTNTQSNYVGKKVKIGKFVTIIEDTIAEGGFGIVFKVRAQNDQVYALKRIYVNNNKDLRVCKREITILSSLTHKNIIPLIDSQINQKSVGIFEVLMLLSYCPNNVIQLMRAKQQMNQYLPENLILNIMCDVIEAVSRLHHCVTPVIHRDLKVDNILIDERNNFVLCDFGSATARHIIPTEYGIGKTEEEISKYTTLSYRPPEMVQLSSQILDCKTDIWALGCMLYYLCFFNLPFGDKILAIQSGKFSIPSSSNTNSPYNYSDNLIKLIKYLLTVDPNNRPSIYQVSELIFTLANKKNPVQNLDREKVPSWSELELPSDCDRKIGTLNESDNNPKSDNIKKSGPTTKVTNTEPTFKVSPSLTTPGPIIQTTATSIAPRNRPRPKQSLTRPILLPNQKTFQQTICPNVTDSNNNNSNISDCIPIKSDNNVNTNPFQETITTIDNNKSNNCEKENADQINKIKHGHRRLASESVIRIKQSENVDEQIISTNLKSAQSNQELTRSINNKDGTDSRHDNQSLFPNSREAGLQDNTWFDSDPMVNQHDPNELKLGLKVALDNVDDFFDAEFDRIRHESSKSGDS